MANRRRQPKWPQWVTTYFYRRRGWLVDRPTQKSIYLSWHVCVRVCLCLRQAFEGIAARRCFQLRLHQTVSRETTRQRTCERGRERRSSGGMETHGQSDVRVWDGGRDWWREKRPPLQTLGNVRLIFLLSSISRALSSLIQQFTIIGCTWTSQSSVHVCVGVCVCVRTVSRASMLAQHRVYLHIYT